MITTIIFDNNGVLTDNDEESTYKILPEYLNLTLEKFKKIWHEEAKKVDKGSSKKEFIENLLKSTNSNRTTKEFMAKHLEISYNLKPAVINYVNNLKKDFEIALLTNFSDSFEEFNKKWHLEDIFKKENMFISYRIKIAKPQKEIYEYVLNQLKRKPEETVFIDDKEENVNAAKALGMNGIVFKNLEQLKTKLNIILNN